MLTYVTSYRKYTEKRDSSCIKYTEKRDLCGNCSERRDFLCGKYTEMRDCSYVGSILKSVTDHVDNIVKILNAYFSGTAWLRRSPRTTR